MQRSHLYSRSRALTGAWIETSDVKCVATLDIVAPSRARGLKQDNDSKWGHQVVVAPSRARGLKHSYANTIAGCPFVAPSRARGLKQQR